MSLISKTILFAICLILIGPVYFHLTWFYNFISEMGLKESFCVAMSTGELLNFSLVLLVFIITDIIAFTSQNVLVEDSFKFVAVLNLIILIILTIFLCAFAFQIIKQPSKFYYIDQCLFVINSVTTTIYIKYKIFKTES